MPKNPDVSNELHQAVTSGDQSKVEAFVNQLISNQASIDGVDRGVNPLAIAVQRGHLSIGKSHVKYHPLHYK